MRYFPLFVDTQELNVLVVGAGEVAARKIELLSKTQARVTIVAPEVAQSVAELAIKHGFTLRKEAFQTQDLTGKQLVFVATNDSELNQNISQQAKALNIQVNVVDAPQACSFITPSIVDRSPITIAMSSGGVAPVLLRHLRQKLEAFIPQRISLLGELAEKYRQEVKRKFATINQRRNFWENVFEGKVAELVLQGNSELGEQTLKQDLKQEEINEQGEVYLVGAGPGDPELLTFKALRLMQKADVVVYDRLVSQGVLELVRRDAEKIYVGKKASKHTVPQEQINQLLATEAQKGKRVVRLKGGDPFIFGRGGEELETLVEHNIPFQVVPGITAASGTASYAGIPLTHRDHAQSVVFATGHLKDDSIDLDWPALVQKQQTLVFYMGLTGLDIICKQLISHGMSADMPIALVQSATTEQQKVVTGTLSNIQQAVKVAGICPPALIIVGTVVSLQSQLNWYRPDAKQLAFQEK